MSYFEKQTINFNFIDLYFHKIIKYLNRFVCISKQVIICLTHFIHKNSEIELYSLKVRIKIFLWTKGFVNFVRTGIFYREL